MPFYEYECTACRYYVEALQKISDDPLRKCPNCNRLTLKRLISAPVFRLKGDGWYETDFKSDQEQKRNLAGREEGGESAAADKSKDATDAGKSEAQPKDKPAESKPAADKAEAGRSRSGRAAASRPAARTSRSSARPPRPAKAAKGRQKKAPARKKSRR